MEVKQTARGFDLIEFIDCYGAECSLQKSSLATDDCIWFGIGNPEIKEFWTDGIPVGKDLDCKWEKRNEKDLVQNPNNTLHVFSRMHLNRETVEELLPYLQHFVETGEIV